MIGTGAKVQCASDRAMNGVVNATPRPHVSTGSPCHPHGASTEGSVRRSSAGTKTDSVEFAPRQGGIRGLEVVLNVVPIAARRSERGSPSRRAKARRRLLFPGQLGAVTQVTVA